jgi:ATP-dependent DNA helicase RecG
MLNPKELIESIWTQVPDWKETYEISEGLWRKSIPAFDEKVVREVLCNAIVHRPYTTRGDIFINMYPDHMEIVNPGHFPLGVSASNILRATVQRNEHMAKVFYDLHLMEKEGSGYDLMYETLLSSGRDIPHPFEGNDYIKVSISRKILNKEASRLFEYIQNNYDILMKGMIALGLILQAKIITVTELSKKLQLPPDERIRSYIGKLLDKEIICKRGSGKGMKYFINPKLISNAKANIRTSLKTMESYRLKALIQEDLKYHPNSLISDIYQRLPDADFKELQQMVRIMAKNGEINHDKGRKYRKYRL